MTKIIVFDIDGTLADMEHRRHWFDGGRKNWDAFFAAQHLDPTHEEIVWMAHQFYETGNTIIICTGRNEGHRKVSEEWLAKFDIKYAKMYMRPFKDHRQDGIVKVELLEQIRKEFGEPYLWIDDRNQVVKAIRDQGVRVLQVCEGDY